MKSIDLGDSPPNAGNQPTRFRGIGYDLDDECTYELTSGEAGAPPPIKQNRCLLPNNAPGVLDGPGGVDNALGVLIQYVRDRIKGFSSEFYSEQLRKGASNTIIRVSGYNGEANDGEIVVETFVSAPFDKDPANPRKEPAWDGQDAFPVASYSTLNDNADSPKFVASKAYVINNQAVASLDSLGLRLDIGLSDIQQVELNLVLYKAYVVCTIQAVPVGDGYQLRDCTLAAKWRADEILQQLSHFPDPLIESEHELCTKSGSYLAFKQAICSLVDTRGTGDIGPTTECDALSMGVRFQTEPGILGNLVKLKTKGELCTPEKGETSKDTCATFYRPGAAGGAPGTGGVPPNTGGRAPSTGGAPGSGGTAASGGTTATDAGGDAAEAGTPDASVN
jgi:hypothetical protein